MRRDAEAHAAEDEKRASLAEARNQADQIAYQTEKTLKEHGDKVSADVREKIEAKRKETIVEARASEDPAAIKKAIEELMETGQRPEDLRGGGEGAGRGRPAGGATTEPGASARAAPRSRPTTTSSTPTSRRSDAPGRTGLTRSGAWDARPGGRHGHRASCVCGARVPRAAQTPGRACGRDLARSGPRVPGRRPRPSGRAAPRDARTAHDRGIGGVGGLDERHLGREPVDPTRELRAAEGQGGPPVASSNGGAIGPSSRRRVKTKRAAAGREQRARAGDGVGPHAGGQRLPRVDLDDDVERAAPAIGQREEVADLVAHPAVGVQPAGPRDRRRGDVERRDVGGRGARGARRRARGRSRRPPPSVRPRARRASRSTPRGRDSGPGRPRGCASRRRRLRRRASRTTRWGRRVAANPARARARARGAGQGGGTLLPGGPPASAGPPALAGPPDDGGSAITRSHRLPASRGAATGAADGGSRPAAAGNTRTRRPSTRRRPSANRRIHAGKRRRSASCTRWPSVAAVSSSSTTTAACATIGPGRRRRPRGARCSRSP